MRFWIVALPCTYVALLCALAYPAVHLAFDADIRNLGLPAALAECFHPPSPEAVPKVVFNPWLHLWVLAMAATQIALLLPAGKPAERPRARRSLTFSLVAASFLAALLSASLPIAIICGIWGDDGLDLLEPTFGWLGLLPDFIAIPILFLSPLMAAWGVWWFILLRATKANPSPGFPGRACRWLLAGSALELIVAIPCHVAARNRGDCCAPAGTFTGIATGAGVALLCCGPALLYLVRDRLRRKSPRAILPHQDEDDPQTRGGGGVLSR